MKAIAILLFAVLVVGCGVAPAPSPAPTPTSVQPEPNAALVAFEGHVAEAIIREGQLVRQLAAASAGTNAELGAAARLIEGWAIEETAWLRAHPAEPCFAEAASAWEVGVSDISTSAVAFLALAAAPAPPSDAEGQAAGARLASGTESLEQAATLARSARVACR
jgi:hypothetical protein